MASLPQLLRDAAAEYATRPWVYRRGENDELDQQSAASCLDVIHTSACGLLAAGVAAGEPVILLSENRPEWFFADAAILSCGAVSVPLYPSLPAEQVAPLVQRVRARFAIVEDRKQLAKLAQSADQLPHLERVWVFDAAKLPADPPEAGWQALAWQALVDDGAAGREALQPEVDARVAAIDDDSVATIIFTSGTTGEPKGAQLTHGNIASNIAGTQPRVNIEEGDRLVSFLPLSHIFQRLVQYFGVSVGAGTLYNESLRRLMADLQLTRPTVLVVVPRVLQMMRDRVMTGIGEKSGLSGTIASWAMDVADRYSRAYVEDRTPSAWLRLQHRLADKRVYSAIREQLGLDAIKFVVSGGAALPPEVGRWFHGVGLPVVQGYGLTETSPVIAANDPRGKLRFDTIGTPIENVEVELAADGELLSRGPHIMKGYFEMPEQTAEAIDAEGWFHTGDLAEWTPDGHLRITDRKKNIIVLANGKNVAPTPIENLLQESPYIDRAMVIGDNQSVVTALVVPNYEHLRQGLSAAGEAVPDGKSREWVTEPAAHRLVQKEIERLSAGLAGFERIRRFRLLPEDFSLEREELTPTMKLRRKRILENYRDLVAEMGE